MTKNRRIIQTKENDEGVWDLVGYTDDPNDYSGYWVKREDSWRQELRVPLACGACGGLIMNWDVQFVNRYGVCSNCTVDWIEGRDLSHLKSNTERTNYCRAKTEEKNARKTSIE